MRITLVVPIRNAERSLGSLLASILAQRRPFDQLVFVVNASTDSSAAIVERFAAAHPDLDLAVVRERVRGPGTARNAGISIATGDIVAFTDADCSLDPAWAETAVRLFAEDPDVGILGGIERPAHRSASFTARFSGFVVLNRCQHEVHRVARKSEWFNGHLVTTMNMAVRQTVLHDLGGFAPWPAGEDIDFWMRALDEGVAMRAFVPDMVVAHEQRETLASYVAQQWGYAFVVPRLMRHHFRGSLFVTTSRRLLARGRLSTALLEVNPHTILFALLIPFGWKALGAYLVFLGLKPLRFVLRSKRIGAPVSLPHAVLMTVVFEAFRWVVNIASIAGSIRHRVLCIR